MIAAVLWFAGPVLTGMGNWNLIVFFVLLLGAGVLIGVYRFATGEHGIDLVVAPSGRGHKLVELPPEQRPPKMEGRNR